MMDTEGGSFWTWLDKALKSIFGGPNSSRQPYGHGVDGTYYVNNPKY